MKGASKKWLRRFLAHVLAVMRHTTAILLGFISGSLVSSPAWIKPLLSPAYNAMLDSWSAAIAQPETYWRFAIACVLGGIFAASFLAWNEERDEKEEKIQELEALKSDKPKLLGDFKGMECKPVQGTEHVEVYVDLEVRNLGAPTALCEWQASIGKSRPSPRIHVAVTAMSEIEKRKRHEADLPELPNFLNDDRILERGGRRRGFLMFLIEGRFMNEWLQPSGGPPFLEISFADVFGQRYSAKLPGSPE